MSRHNFGVKHTHLNIHAPTFTCTPNISSSPSYPASQQRLLHPPKKSRKKTFRKIYPSTRLLAYLLIISPILSLKYYIIYQHRSLVASQWKYSKRRLYKFPISHLSSNNEIANSISPFSLPHGISKYLNVPPHISHYRGEAHFPIGRDIASRRPRRPGGLHTYCNHKSDINLIEPPGPNLRPKLLK